MKRFYLIVQNRSIIKELSTKLLDSYSYQFAGLSTNKEEILKKVRQIIKSDLIIMSGHIDNLSDIELVRFVNSLLLTKFHYKRIVRCYLFENEIEEKRKEEIIGAGVDVLLSLKWSGSKIKTVLDDAFHLKYSINHQPSVTRVLTDGLDIPPLNKALTSILHDSGIPASLSGYLYLKRAIEIAFLNYENIKTNITAEIYPLISTMYNSSVTRVDRAIRHALESGWDRAKPDTIGEIFHNSIKKKGIRPTNSEYIAVVSEYLIHKLKKQRQEYLELHQQLLKNSEILL